MQLELENNDVKSAWRIEVVGWGCGCDRICSSGYDDFANGNGVVSLLLGKELVDGSEGVGAQN